MTNTKNNGFSQLNRFYFRYLLHTASYMNTHSLRTCTTLTRVQTEVTMTTESHTVGTPTGILLTACYRRSHAAANHGVLSPRRQRSLTSLVFRWDQSADCHVRWMNENTPISCIDFTHKVSLADEVFEQVSTPGSGHIGEHLRRICWRVTGPKVPCIDEFFSSRRRLHFRRNRSTNRFLFFLFFFAVIVCVC